MENIVIHGSMLEEIISLMKLNGKRVIHMVINGQYGEPKLLNLYYKLKMRMIFQKLVKYRLETLSSTLDRNQENIII